MLLIIKFGAEVFMNIIKANNTLNSMLKDNFYFTTIQPLKINNFNETFILIHMIWYHKWASLGIDTKIPIGKIQWSALLIK